MSLSDNLKKSIREKMKDMDKSSLVRMYKELIQEQKRRKSSKKSKT